jgi:hypothetical protein
MMMIVGTTSSMTEDVMTRLVEVDEVDCLIRSLIQALG